MKVTQAPFLKSMRRYGLGLLIFLPASASVRALIAATGVPPPAPSSLVVCSPPGEVPNLLFTNYQTLVWGPPVDPGSPGPVHYDTLRARSAGEYGSRCSAACIEIDGSDQTTIDPETPPPGTAFFYQIGARNPCGDGGLGFSSSGAPRIARSCSGGNDGLEAPNGEGRSPSDLEIASQPASKNAGLVSLHSGEFRLEETDLLIPGRGFDFEWRRNYRSREGRLTAMGQNWDFSYDLRVEVSGDNPADRWLHDGRGRRDTYQPIGGDCWTAAGFFRELCRQMDGSYILTFPDKTTWTLAALNGSPTAGRILQIQDRNLNAMTFGYDPGGRLTTVSDTLGRVIQVSYDADGYISAVTDFTGRQVRYGHYQAFDSLGSAGDLASCTRPAVTGTPNGNDFPDGKTTVYTYTRDLSPEARNHNLLTITDPRGQTFLTNTYAPALGPMDPLFDRIDEQAFSGASIEYVYVRQIPTSGNGFATTKTIVNDRAGNVREASFDAANRLVLLREDTGRAPDPFSCTNDSVNRPVGKLRVDDPDLFETLYEYDADSLLTGRVQPNGNMTTWVYEIDLNPGAPRRIQGNLREIHRLPGPFGGDQIEIVETFEYEPGFGSASLMAPRFITRHVDGRGNPELHTYDARGNRLHTQHRISTSVEDYEYNAFGQMTANVLPDNGSGSRRRDEYTYYASGLQRGYLQSRIVDTPGFALTTSFEYDAAGNVVRTIDPRGHDTQFSVNTLDQIVRMTSREAATGGGIRYHTDSFYDADDNLVRIDVENKNEAGVLQPNANLTTVNEYDLFDDLVRTCRETGVFMGSPPGPPESPACLLLPASEFATTEYQYDANHNRILTRMGEAVEGRQPANALNQLYDERDLVFMTIGGAGDIQQSSTRHDYDGNRNDKAVHEGIESGEHVTTHGYDGYDRLVTSTDPMGNVRTFQYDGNGNPIVERIAGQLIDSPGPGGNVRLFERAYQYDAMDRPIQTDTAFYDTQTQIPILDGQSTVQTAYTDASQVRTVTDDNSHISKTFYDTANRPSQVTDSRLNSVTYTYDANSNFAGTTELDRSDLGNPNETFVSTYGHDNLDRLTMAVDNTGNTNQYAYDSRSNRVVRVDARNVETRWGYDGLNRLIQTVRDMNGDGASSLDPADIVTRQTWDDSSRLTSHVDDNLNVTRYAYDALDRRIVTQRADGTLDQDGTGANWPLGPPDPDLSGFTSGYDAHGDATLRTDANGSIIRSVYDALDRLTSRSITPGTGVAGPPFGTTHETYQYDGLSRLVRAQDEDSLVTRAYDSLSNVTKETAQLLSPPGPVRTIGATYDGDALPTRIVYPGARTVVRIYDSLHRPLLIRDDPPGPGTTVATYFYKGPSRIERRDDGNDTRLDVGYDGDRRIANMLYSRISTSAVIDQRAYDWDPMDNKAHSHKILPSPPEDHFYAYDAADRLVFSQVPPAVPVQYTLDGNGNRLAVSGGSNPGPYSRDPTLPEPGDDQMNQYTTSPFETSRVYDRDGNLLQSAFGPARSFAYDYRNRLVQFNDPGAGQSATYRYDALGRRIEKSVNGAIARFYYDGLREIEEQSSTNTTLATYVWGCGANEILQMNRGGQKHFYHADDQGSPIKVTGSAGSLEEQYKYDDYGKPSFFNAFGSPISGTAIGNPYVFLTHRFDPETNLGLFGPRVLDYRSGGYAQRDIWGGWSDPDASGNGRIFALDNPTGAAAAISVATSDPTPDGTMSIHHPPEAGGTFTNSLRVQPPFTFVRVGIQEAQDDPWGPGPGWKVPDAYAGRLQAARVRRAQEFLQEDPDGDSTLVKHPIPVRFNVSAVPITNPARIQFELIMARLCYHLASGYFDCYDEHAGKRDEALRHSDWDTFNKEKKSADECLAKATELIKDGDAHLALAKAGSSAAGK